MIEYNDKEYDVPSILFIQEDIEGEVTLLTEEEVLDIIDSVYTNVSKTLKDAFLERVYEANYKEARERFEISQVPHYGDNKVLQKKKAEYIQAEKRRYQARLVPAMIEGVEYNFYGGLENARKYKEAFDLAISLGLAKGKIGVAEGLVEIGSDDMNAALRSIGLQVYKGWLKSSYYLQAIFASKTKEDLDAIVWKDSLDG